MHVDSFSDVRTCVSSVEHSTQFVVVFCVLENLQRKIFR
jgi:hypothetical protein